MSPQSIEPVDSAGAKPQLADIGMTLDVWTRACKQPVHRPFRTLCYILKWESKCKQNSDWAHFRVT